VQAVNLIGSQPWRALAYASAFGAGCGGSGSRCAFLHRVELLAAADDDLIVLRAEELGARLLWIAVVVGSLALAAGALVTETIVEVAALLVAVREQAMPLHPACARQPSGHANEHRHLIERPGIHHAALGGRSVCHVPAAVAFSRVLCFVRFSFSPFLPCTPLR
jgi:hypothetical protein